MSFIELPGKGRVQGYQTGAEGSPAAAAAPFRALGGVGKELQGLGEQANAFAVKLQRLDNAERANNLEIAAAKEYADFQNEIATNPNPAAWPELWQKRLDRFKQANVPEDMAPEQRAVIGQRFADFSSKTAMDVARNATVSKIDQSRRSYGNLIDLKQNSGDFSGAEAHVAEMEAQGLIDKPAAERMSMDIGTKKEIHDVIESGKSKPQATIAAIDEKNPDGTYKNYPNLSDSARDSLKGEIKGQQREYTQNAIDSFQNMIADRTLNRPEQIEQLAQFVGLEPRFKERMQDILRTKITDEERDNMASPGGQAELRGNLIKMLGDYQAQPTESRDMSYLEMKQMLTYLAPGTSKAQLAARLDEARKGQLTEWKRKQDPYIDRFKNIFDGGGYGVSGTETPIDEVISKGILLDREKLKGRGFSDDQAFAIQSIGMTDAELKAHGWERPVADTFVKFGFSKSEAAKLATASGPDARKTIFQALDGKRQGMDRNDEWDRAAYDVIASGKKGMVWMPDPVKEREALRSLGNDVDEFERWAALHPDGDMEAAFRHIAGKKEEEVNQNDFYPPVEGVQHDTKSNPGKVWGRNGNAELPQGGGNSGDTILPPKQ